MEESGFTLPKEKCKFGRSKLSSFGYVFNAEGVPLNSAKMSNIKDAKAPTSALEVRSFVGMATYFTRFIPELAKIAAPLRKLTQNEMLWEWAEHHQQAFQ
ncbi:uncharacterized protein [Ambystoma mexicanum]|uniref:uncharacterized protein n=1 Tax=Ambystoma mexicanum TaxID=8296 RepID=UPI0037E93BEC